MINRHTTFYVNKVKPLNLCGNVIGHMVEVNSFEPPFEIEPTKGEHDFNNCVGCQKNLNELIERLKKKFEGDGVNKKEFPFCCTYHSNLENINEFNRTAFVNVPEMVAKKIIYTNQHITNNHSSENWYKEITDYIEWTVVSFGQMPTGCGESLYLSDYFLYVSNLLKQKKDISTEKQNSILKYIKSYQTPQNTNTTDWNILLKTYEKWLKMFPFEISYFSNLKQHFEKQLPILNGKIEENIYSGLAKAKIHSENSLIEALVNMTKQLLRQFITGELLKKELIPDINKHKIELLNENHRIKQDRLLGEFSKGEIQYIDVLEKWLSNEKYYFKGLSFIEKSLSPQHNGNIDWIDLFESIDIENSFAPSVHIINTLQQKKNYFSNASFNLTVQYLKNFKKETYLLSNNRKAEYIKGLNIVPPPVVKTESSLNNQTIFEAQSNYFEFLEQYKTLIENSSPPLQIKQFNENTKDVINALKEYKFSEYLIKKELNENKVFQLINNHSGKDLMPYTIALLSETKYLDYFFKEFCKTKVEGFEKLRKVFNVNQRRVKGNVNILNSGSNEDPTQYTSYQHKENIQKELEGL